MLRIDKNNFQLHFEAIAFSENGNAYGASADFNGLFKIDMLSGECKYINAFPGEDMEGKRLYFAAAYYNGKVFFAPQSAEHIAIYDIDNDKIITISIDADESIKFNRNMKFADILVYEREIFLFGATYPYVLKLDAETYQLEYIPIDIEECFCFRKGGCIKGESYFIPSVNSNVVLEFNLKEKQTTIHRIPCEFTGSWSMCSDGRFFWLIPRGKGSGFVRWNKDTNQAIVLKDFPKDFLGDSNAMYIKSYYSNGYVWAIPEQANMFLKIDVDSLKIEREDRFPILVGEKVGFYFERRNDIYLVKKEINQPFFGQDGNDYFKINMDDFSMVPYKFLFTEGYKKFKYDYMLNRLPLMSESKEVGLNDFIDFVSFSAKACD